MRLFFIPFLLALAFCASKCSSNVQDQNRQACYPGCWYVAWSSASAPSNNMSPSIIRRLDACLQACGRQ
ncbi:unnamed protein product [Dicrocoelium dendriticum]|nr:unnamed protein product [Dicrocoelium dendriticum]